MTEDQWNSCRHPVEMLDFLRGTGRLSERKLRLFACVCCRRIRLMMMDTPSRTLVEVTEGYADGLASDEEFSTATKVEVWAPAMFAAKANASVAYWFAARAEAGDAVQAEGGDAPWPKAREKDWTAARFSAWLAQVSLLKDIFGNPFNPPAPITPSLLTPLVSTLALASYNERILPAGTLDPARL